MDQAIYTSHSACWARLPSITILFPVPINIFGYVIIPKDLIWCALCYAMKTSIPIFALCAMLCDYGDSQSVLISICFYAWWEQILCSSTADTTYHFPNDKQK
jgi:hypothetical protein